MSIVGRLCPRCGELKPPKAFSHNGKGQVRPYCKPCSAQEVRAIGRRRAARTAEQIAADRARLRPDGRKRCPGCGKLLAFDAFANSRYGADGLGALCRACRKVYMAARRGGDPR